MWLSIDCLVAAIIGKEYGRWSDTIMREWFLSTGTSASVRPHVGAAPDAADDLARNAAVVTVERLEVVEDTAALRVFEADNPYQRELSSCLISCLKSTKS